MLKENQHKTDVVDHLGILVPGNCRLFHQDLAGLLNVSTLVVGCEEESHLLIRQELPNAVRCDDQYVIVRSYGVFYSK